MSRATQTLDLAVRHSLVTVLLVWRTVFGGLTVKAAERCIASLVAAGLLKPYPFLGRRCVYGPTPKLARIRGMNENRYRKPPGAQAIYQSLSIAMFALLSEPRIRLMTRKEFETYFPTLAVIKGFAKNRYFRDISDPAKPRLALIVPDFNASFAKIVRKARKELEKRKQHNAFRVLIQNDVFKVVIVTTHEPKAVQIRSKLRNDPFKNFTVVTVPALAELLGGVQ